MMLYQYFCKNCFVIIKTEKKNVIIVKIEKILSGLGSLALISGFGELGEVRSFYCLATSYLFWKASRSFSHAALHLEAV